MLGSVWLPQSLKNLYHGFVALLAVLVFRYPARTLTVIGITGTDGKTTTAHLVYHLLKQARIKVALLSTVGTVLGTKVTPTGLHVTTPDPWALQRWLRQVKNHGFSHVVLEATSHGLDQHRLWGTHIQVALITNITPEHLDYHHQFAKYLQTKAKIMGSARLVLLHRSDPLFNRLAALVPARARLVSYSLQAHSEFSEVLKATFPEPYNQLNAMAASSLVAALGITPAQIIEAIPTFPGVFGRMTPVSNHRGLRLIVDFAHTPNGLQQALRALRTSCQGHLIAVYGSAGQRDRQKRPQLGAIGADLADEVILTAEDPRGEAVPVIIHQMLEGVKHHHGHVHAIQDRQVAINFAIKLATAGDTVAVFGKGHELSLNIDGRHESPWSDYQAIKRALA